MLPPVLVSLLWVLLVVTNGLLPQEAAVFGTTVPLPMFHRANSGSGPHLLFTDLESGPNTGGENDLGAFITLYGEGFGSERGSSTVTIGNKEVVAYVVWGEDNAARDLDMIVVQPGRDTVSGDIMVTVNGTTSNPLPFTFRPGTVHFVATSGDDADDGNFVQPWRTIAHAKNSMGAGDIVYVMDGITETTEENFGAVLSVESSGIEGAPKALVAYPGAVATIGSTGLEFGIRVPNIGVAATDWVIAKLVLRGQVQALDIGGSGASRWRVVGNDISCPVGDGQTGCFAASLADHIAFLGNEVHDISTQGSQPSKQYHAVYFTTDTNHVEVGWNHIHDNMTCRAVQFHSSPLDGHTGYNQYDLIVHDNLIHGDVCDGINFATVDPSKGPVRAYNNIIYDIGRGPAPPDGDANYTCIYVAGGTNTGADGTGVVEIYNNTLYDCGARQNTDSGAFGRGPGSPGLLMRLTNNLVYVVSGESYLSPSSNLSLIVGSHNWWFGGQSGPDFLIDNVGGDPLLVDVPSGNFRLQACSPAIDAGIAVESLSEDFAGNHRPQDGDGDGTAGHDIGAFEVD